MCQLLMCYLFNTVPMSKTHLRVENRRLAVCNYVAHDGGNRVGPMATNGKEICGAVRNPKIFGSY
jgi:hypothetical protein